MYWQSCEGEMCVTEMTDHGWTIVKGTLNSTRAPRISVRPSWTTALERLPERLEVLGWKAMLPSSNSKSGVGTQDQHERYDNDSATYM